MPPFDSSKPFNFEKLRFYAFQHPYVCTFVERLQKDGVAELLTPANQLWQRDNAAYKDTAGASLKPPKGPYFKYRYKPGDVVSPKYPRYDVDFDLSGAYAQYNWELFFHVPLMIAARLSKTSVLTRRSSGSTTSSTRPPLRQAGSATLLVLAAARSRQPEPIQQTLAEAPARRRDPRRARGSRSKQWRKHPFEPHLIAR